MVNRGASRAWVMDEDHQFLQPRAPLLPTSVPHGVEEALRSIRYRRQTGQVPPRVGHEDQTPVLECCDVPCYGQHATCGPG
jgi:hypothetical protein